MSIHELHVIVGKRIPRPVMVSVVVLLASCGGGSPLEPPQAPDPPATAVQAEAVPTVTEAAKSSAETVVAEAVPAVTAATEAVPVVTAATEAVPVVTAATEAVPVVTAATEAVPAVTASDAAASTTATAVAVDAGPSITTAAAASSTTTAAAGETPTETTPPSTTVSENAVVRVDESVLEPALAVMLKDFEPLRPLVVSFYYITEDRVAADFCLEASVDGRVIYRHDQRVVDRGASDWEIIFRSGTNFHSDFESCDDYFN